MIRLALLPQDGGTTYTLNTFTREVRREGCINEAYPLTYWRQRSIKSNRGMVAKAMKEANLQWPWEAAEEPLQ